MKKIFSFLFAALVTVSAMGQTVVDFTAATIADVSEFTLEGFTFKTAKNDGATAPTQNANYKDLRLYAKNTLEVISGSNMTEMVFAISFQGKKRLAPITASVGDVTVDAEAWTVTWSGNADDVTFTVGDAAADYAGEPGKAGQFDFDKVTITVGEAPAVAKPVISATEVNFAEQTTIDRKSVV